jgi:hypothetical protein
VRLIAFSKSPLQDIRAHALASTLSFKKKARFQFAKIRRRAKLLLQAQSRAISRAKSSVLDFRSQIIAAIPTLKQTLRRGVATIERKTLLLRFSLLHAGILREEPARTLYVRRVRID